MVPSETGVAKAKADAKERNLCRETASNVRPDDPFSSNQHGPSAETHRLPE